MNEEIKEIERILATSGKYITYAERCYVLDYITNLEEKDKEIERLKRQLEYLRSGEYLNQVKWERDFNEKLVENLQDTIDTLRKDLLNYFEEWKDVDDEYYQGKCSMARDVLRELEGEDKNE